MGRSDKFWKTILAAGAGIGALAAVNAVIRRNVAEPDDATFGGEPRQYLWKWGRIFYKFAGVESRATPVVFIHGFGAGTSSFMWRKNFDSLAFEFPTYAIDLLGFGFSDKPSNAPYSTELYADMLADFVQEVAGSPVNVVANSLSASFVLRVADRRPELVDQIVLVAPAISGNANGRPGMAGAAFYGLMQSPVLGTSFYNVMTSERSIRDFAREQLFFDPTRVTNRIVSQHYSSSHQPGAQHAISAYLSGYLNTDTREEFARLQHRVTLVWGKQDRTNPIEHAAELLQLNPRANLEIFDRCRMTPHEEHPDKFNALLKEILHAR